MLCLGECAGKMVGQVMVVNRTFETAVELARELSATPVPLDRFRSYLPLADLVVGSAGGGQLVAWTTCARRCASGAASRCSSSTLPVPRNFDAASTTLDGAYLYDIDDLAAVVEDNLDERRREAVRAEAIVEAEVGPVLAMVRAARRRAHHRRAARVRRQHPPRRSRQGAREDAVGQRGRSRAHPPDDARHRQQAAAPSDAGAQGRRIDRGGVAAAGRGAPAVRTRGRVVKLRVGTRRSPLALTQTGQALTSSCGAVPASRSNSSRS